MSATPETQVPIAETPVRRDIDNKLAQAWSRERWYYHLRGLGQLVPWVLGLFLFDLALDWLLDPPGAARTLLLLANLAVLGVLGYQYWLRHLRRFDPTRVSLQVESLHAGLNSLLVSYVQSDSKQGGAVHGSPQMIAAMREQAVRTAVPLDFRGIVTFRTLRKLLAVSGCLLVVFLASSLWAGEYYAILVGRLLNPFTTLAYPTRTKIDEVNGPTAVKQGDTVELSASASGEIPDQGFLYIKFEGASWEKLLVARQEGKAGGSPTFPHRIAKAGQSFTYYFSIGDARSERKQVQVISTPRIVEAHVSLNYPTYTGRSAETITGLQIPPTPEGTAVSWELRCDQPLAQGRLSFGGEEPRSFPLEIDPANPHVARLYLGNVGDLLNEAQVRSSAVVLAYHFEWTEREHQFTFSDPTRYVMEVVPDKPPIITLLKPRTGGDQDQILATPQIKLQLIFEANDDYGLGKAWIIYRVKGQPGERRLAIGSFPAGTKNDSFESHWTVKESLPDIKAGDILTCQIEASDNREGKAGPNLSRSSIFHLQVVNDEEYKLYIGKKIAQGLERTTAAAREEQLSAKRVKSLIPEK